jgi:hypothetical protein
MPWVFHKPAGINMLLEAIYQAAGGAYVYSELVVKFLEVVM